MAICLECSCPDARVTMSRVVPDGDALIQARVLLCPNCGLMGQVIRSTGPAIKIDIDHKKDPACIQVVSISTP